MKSLIVIKYGSSCISADNIKAFTKQIKKLRERDIDVIVVSSGSVRMGKELGGRLIDSSASLRVWAALGSAHMVETWQKSFMKRGIVSAQVLLTHADLDDSSFLDSSLKELLNMGVVTIVNENDVLSDTELVKLNTGGDNDGLAAHLASRLGADKLILISNGVEGYISKGKVQKEVELMNLDEKDFFSKNHHGTGGIESKVNAARSALQGGVKQVFYGGIKSRIDDILSRKSGTEFKL